MAESEAAGVATVDESGTTVGRAAAHCWALLLARIYECLPLACPNCGEPMWIIAFIPDRPVIERILTHIGEPKTPPEVLPATAVIPGSDSPSTPRGSIIAPDGRVCAIWHRIAQWRLVLGVSGVVEGTSEPAELTMASRQW